MAALGPLHTLDSWTAATPEQRSEVGQSLAASTGFDEGEPVGRFDFRTLRHPTGCTLVAVPGGVFWSGLSDADLHVLFTHLGGAAAGTKRWEEMRREVELATPQLVRVAPFLCSAEPWGQDGPADLDDEPWGYSLEEIASSLEQHGARVPTASEWEWVAREGGTTPWVGVPPEELPIEPRRIPRIKWGGPHGFGLGGLHISDTAELVTSEDGQQLRGGHGMWQDDLEAIALLCGYRWRLNDQEHVPYRLTFSLDAPAPDGHPPLPTAPDDEIGRALARLRAQ